MKTIPGRDCQKQHVTTFYNQFLSEIHYFFKNYL